MANEKRLIDANALMDEFRAYMVDRYDREKCFSEENCKTCDRPCLWWRKVNEAPTVDAVEVVHGRWVLCQDDGYEWYECSSCRTQPLNDNVERPVLSDYCPNCGAKMDGGNEDGTAQV